MDPESTGIADVMRKSLAKLDALKLLSMIFLIKSEFPEGEVTRIQSAFEAAAKGAEDKAHGAEDEVFIKMPPTLVKDKSGALKELTPTRLVAHEFVAPVTVLTIVRFPLHSLQRVYTATPTFFAPSWGT